MSFNLKTPPLVSCLLLGAAALLGACAQQETKADTNLVLARVGEKAITEQNFKEALQRLVGDTQTLTLEEWRQRFQILIDTNLLLATARERGLNEQPSVRQAIANWERNWLVGQLLQREMAEELSWSEEELNAFYTETGSSSEIRLQRVDIQKRDQALALLEKLNAGDSFIEVAKANGIHPRSTDWLNLLMVDARYAPLFLLDEGAVELIEAEGRYLLVQIASKREVALEERRGLVEHNLKRRKEQAANIAYLARIAERYAVQLDTAALAQVIAGKGTSKLRLLKSSLGEWTQSEYLQTMSHLQQGDAAQAASTAELGFRVTRAYVADLLLSEEARRQGLHEEMAAAKEKVLQQKTLEALWESDIYSQVSVDENELRAFYEQNKEHYAALANDAQKLNIQVGRDLREAKAAPIFDQYIDNLRQQSAAQVQIEEDNFREFVARQRQNATPVDL
ncbi:MAG: hypothetical protein ACI906_004705 [Candidatus Latescibacterota bacterium]